MDWTNFSIVLIILILLIEVWLSAANHQSVIKSILNHIVIAIAVICSPIVFSLLAVFVVLLCAIAAVVCIGIGVIIAAIILLCAALVVVMMVAIMPFVPFATLYEMCQKKL